MKSRSVASTAMRWPGIAGLALLGISACAGSGGGSGSGSGSGSGAVTDSIAVNPATIAPGSAAMLSWSSANASACTAGGAWSGSQPTSSPGISVSPAAGSYTYTLSCSGPDGSASASATLTVAPPLSQRIAAARATAGNTAPTSSCGAISQNASGSNDGFYWEIGDQGGIVGDAASGSSAAGSVQPAGAGGTNYSRTSALMVASASKWIYGAYVAERLAQQHGGQWSLPAATVPFLHFTSGYDNMTDHCPAVVTPTVQDCLNYANGSGPGAEPNGTLSPGDVGRFYYNSGHLEVLEGGAAPAIAGVMNGAGDDDSALASAVVSAFAARGVKLSLSYVAPILAGGVMTTPGDYAAFLQGIIRPSNPLLMAHFLNATASDPYAVCTNPGDPHCVDSGGNPLAIYTPIPASVSWHYSITHWIEDDPASGDGSFSSPGKFGFYPWIDATKTYYGIVARYDNSMPLSKQDAPYYKSVVCGAAIRKAFMSGQAQN